MKSNDAIMTFIAGIVLYEVGLLILAFWKYSHHFNLTLLLGCSFFLTGMFLFFRSYFSKYAQNST